MSIGFVSTSILLESASSDGKFEEKRVDSEEVKLAEKMAKEASQKPLWEQLKEKEDAKEEEFEAFRKAIYAPPPGLDSEDANFLEEARLKRCDALTMRREEDERALGAWKAAAAQKKQSSVKKLKTYLLTLNEIRVSNLTVGAGAKLAEKAQEQRASCRYLKVVVNKRKRQKVEGCDSDQGKSAAAPEEGTENLNSGPQSESKDEIISQPPETASPSPGLANLLEGYSSGGGDSDD